MARVIHTGDTHIGYRQYHSSERRQDFLDAFEHVIDDAIAEDVDAVLHAGDLFHDTRPAIPDLMATVEVLRRLADADIPFLGVVGNHEATRDRQWLDLFTDLDLARRLDEEGVRIDGTTFYGLDYVPPSRRDELTYAFDRPDTEHAALVAHGLFEPFAHADWDTERLLEDSTVDFDALLLGDNHAWGQERFLDTWVTYCGSTERTSAAEEDMRGYNIVEFTDGSVSITRRSLEETRPWKFVPVNLQGEEGTERAVEEALSYDLEDAVVIVRITGEGTDVSPAVIEERLAQSGALIVRVIDEREIADEEDAPSVQFADPDRAVDERLRELPLSGAGELVDAVVRDETVADANVRDRVRSRAETLLAEAPQAFERREPESDQENANVQDAQETASSSTNDPTTESEEADAQDGPETTPASTDEPTTEPEEDPAEDGQASIAEFG